jgi:hypothetical protein
MNSADLLNKALTVVSSCYTLDQLKVAANYVRLVKTKLPIGNNYYTSPRWVLEMALYQKESEINLEFNYPDNGEEHW